MHYRFLCQSVNLPIPLFSESCTESTTIDKKFPIISSARWELTDKWDCAGNDIKPYGDNKPTWGKDGAVEARKLCAKRCLELPTCVAFNYPYSPRNSKCYMKHRGQKSSELGISCGRSTNNWQYYTLLDKSPSCQGILYIEY